ncbi:tyrosine-type recombinase/integrase [Proteiniclasticum sp.]|uniref:tyrosine-type recombinase/integrase n=1 Tax=Proteiniclasticum sp. TaxID=2053595 RepID=UPI00344BD20A
MSKDQLLFPNKNNSYIYPQKVGQKLESICSRIGLRYISPHWFRHTHVSLLNEASTDYKEISERVGHSNIKQTMNTYAHVSPQKLLETANTFSDYINSAESDK